jgi:MFS family permease
LFFYVRDSLHSSNVNTDTAIVFLLFTISGITGAVLSAKPTNRGDKRMIVSIATTITAFALLLFAAAHSVFVAYLAGALAGGSWGAFITADWALAVGILPENAMASAMGVWNLAASIPAILAPLISAPVVLAANARSAGLGPRTAFVLVALEFTIGTLWLWRLPRSVVGPRCA